MSDLSESKLNVLLVDDDGLWSETLKAQSDKLSRSRLNIELSYTFDDGLENLVNKPFDVVVVDLFLDQDRRAFDFVRTARERGVSLPYIIISSAVRSEILGDSDGFGEFV